VYAKQRGLEQMLWHCLGVCQAGGSVIDWVMRTEGVSFRHAAELLRDGIPGAPSGPAPQRSTVRKLASPVDRTAAGHELLGQVVDYSVSLAPEGRRSA
jgi:DNA primase